MVILNESINKIRDLMNTNIDECDWGTGTTAAKVTDTGLETEISSIEQTTNNSTSSKTLQVTGVLPSTDGNSNTITEAVIRYSDGTEHTRRVFTGITKTSNKEIHTIITTTINQA